MNTRKFICSCTPLVALCLLVGTDYTASAALSASRPLAARVYHVLNLPAGNHAYLPYLARLVAAVDALHGAPTGPGNLEGVLRTHLTDARALVNAINSGADPVALRSALVTHAMLDPAQYVDLAAWKYGSGLDRLLVVSALNLRAEALRHAGRRRRAAEYARAGLILHCQSAFIDGWRAALFVYAKIGWARRYGSMVGNAAQVRAILRHREGFRRLLQLSAGQQQQIDQLWTQSHRAAAAGFTAYLQKLTTLTDGFGSKRAAIPSRVAVSYLDALAGCLRTATTLHRRYVILGYAFYTRRQLDEFGHPELAKGVAKELEEWRARVAQANWASASERSAVLRWIKEAAGP